MGKEGDNMMEEVIAREIVNPLKKEPCITPIEMKVYSDLMHKNKETNDNCEVAKDLYDQLIDKKTEEQEKSFY